MLLIFLAYHQATISGGLTVNQHFLSIDISTNRAIVFS